MENGKDHHATRKRKIEQSDVEQVNGDPATEPKRPAVSPVAQSLTLEEAREYRAGSILRVFLKDFVTYSRVEFRPGSRLNVVIGPNGTGKSSIVCALALGLGADPKVLGRAKEEHEFIKEKQSDAIVEIELKGREGKENVTIKRRIYRKGAGDSSDWWINGKKSTKRLVQETVNELNIQVDNLCQFLPQDRVAKFAEMDSIELLRETERAVGTGDMLRKHEELIELRKREKDTEGVHESKEKVLEEKKRMNEMLERDVIRFREREKLMAQQVLLRKKRPWMDFEHHRIETNAIKEVLTKQMENLKVLEERNTPLKRKLEKFEKHTAETEKEKAKNNEKLKKIDAERKESGKKLEELEISLENTQSSLDGLKKRTEQRKKNIEEKKKELTRAQKELVALQDPGEVKLQQKEKQEKLKEVDQGIYDIQNDKKKLETQSSDLKRKLTFSQNKLRDIANQKNQRIQSIKNSKENVVYKVYEWLQVPQNTSTLKKPVVGPILLDINVEKSFASALEHMVKGHIYKFVCSDESDRKFLIEKLYNEGKLKFSLVNTQQLDEQTKHPCPDAELKKYGKFYWLSEIFEAPTQVKQTLINIAKLNDVPFFPELDSKVAFKCLTEMRNLRFLMNKEQLFSKVVSKYDETHITVNSDYINEAKILSNIDTREKARLEEEIEKTEKELKEIGQRVTESQNKLKELQTESSRLKGELESLKSIFGKRGSIERRISSIEAEIKDYEGEDTAHEEETLKKKVSKINLDRYNYALELDKIMQRMLVVTQEQDYVILGLLQVKSRHAMAQAEYFRANSDFMELEREKNRTEEQFKFAKTKLKELKQRAETHAPLTPELEEQFRTLPDTVEGIDEEIRNAEKKIELAYSGSPDVVHQYELRKKEIEELERSIQEAKHTKANERKRMEILQKEWVLPLEELVVKIGKQFGELFHNMGCAGEVELHKQDFDYDKYALNIKVRFRKEEALKTLNAKTQSGGERSVSTMLFLISLQELTPCPFRLVDEINQGMDPNNERMVFTEIARIASKPNLPQYFLITPKLLPDLKFTDDMTVLCVMNGTGAPSQDGINGILLQYLKEP